MTTRVVPGVRVTCHLGGGGPLTLAELDERLDEYGFVEEPDDTVDGEVISVPAEWEFASQTCGYVAAWVNGLPQDGPPERPKNGKGRGRHQWAANQAVRLTCALRHGCINESTWHTAQIALGRRLAELRAATGETVPAGEIPGLFKLGEQRTACKTDEQVRAELGGHVHPKPPKPMTLADAHGTFAKWLGDEYDTDALDAVLAVAAVERFHDGGDPAWLLLISGPGNAKTETVQGLSGIGAVIVSSISSEAALLSATPQKERSGDATGGLLRKLGDRGVLVIKDMTTILSANRDTRAGVLAALREIYDGYWAREVGTDGGMTIPWRGRIAVVGAVTTAWDTAHAVIATMGDRFVLVRMDSTTGRQAAGRKAIGNTGSETAMRRELADAVAGVIAGMNEELISLAEAEAEALLAAGDLVTLARTGVEYDYRGDVIDAHAPEMPTRFVKQLTQIMRGAVAVGMNRGDALRLAIRCARDSMPPLRLAIIEDLAAHPYSTASDVRRRVNRPRATVDRQLQALHMLGIASVDEETYAGDKIRWYYTLAENISPLAIDPQCFPVLSLITPNPAEREAHLRHQKQGTPKAGSDITGKADGAA